MQALLELLQRFQRAIWDQWLFRFATYLFLGIWALAGDPFRLSSNSDQVLSQAYHNFQVQLSGVPQPPLTVVTLNREDIQLAYADGFFASDDWPLNYADHYRLLVRLLDPGDHLPTALFYDIFFEQPRSSSGDLNALGNQLDRLAQHDDLASVYLAGGGDYMPISQAAADALGDTQLTPTAWTGMNNYYPLAAPLVDDGVPKPTPAMKMYQALCEAGDQACPELSVTQKPISIRWALSEGANCVPEGWLDRGFQLASRIKHSILQGLFGFEPPPPADSDCLPVRTLRLQQLREHGFSLLPPPGVAPGEPYGVMVGVEIPSAGDFHPTPIYQPMAGVFLHAMAFENLWRLRDQYLHYHDFKMLTLGIWGLAVAGFMRQARYRHQRSFRPQLFIMMCWWAAIVGAVVLLQLVFNHWLHIVPEGWLSLVAILPLLREVVLRNEAAYQNQKTR